MDSISRRGFLAGAAGVAGLGALGLTGCSSSGNSTNSSGSNPPGSAARPSGTIPLPQGKDAPFDTVVVLMMENRSFDSMLGWMPGANGKQSGITYADATGKSYGPWPLAPNWQGCEYQDPGHLWQQVDKQFNGGKCDGFLQTQPVGDQFPLGYYVAADLPILSSLAQNYTLFDNYFCSMLGPTWPNRFYQLSATTDVPNTGFFPTAGQPRPSKLELAIFDRTKAAGLSSAYYTWGEPMTELYASGKYDSLTLPYTQFFTDAAAGKLPNVTFIDPDYTGEAEFNGTSNDYHPYGSVQASEAYVAKVYDAVRTSPQWGRTVMVLNFDEHGGFYDHVMPPAVADDTAIPGPGPHPNLKNLGFRVPAIAISPFAPKKIETAGPYEHCSVLKMIEWRWGLQPMTIRDANAKNLADALDFTTTRAAIELPAFTPAPVVVCTNAKHLP